VILPFARLREADVKQHSTVECAAIRLSSQP